MRIAVLGGDGYCGWATALYLSARGNDVAIVDNFIRRMWDHELGAQTLTPIRPLAERLNVWKQLTGKTIESLVGDICDYEFLAEFIRTYEPEAIIHFAEQRSAPYSMIDRKHAVFTQLNNVEGTLNLLYAIHDLVPDCHLVKLGTMGEYGTPNIDIEEGYIKIEHNGRSDVLAVPQAARLVLSPVEGARQPQHRLRLQDLGYSRHRPESGRGVWHGDRRDGDGRGAHQPLRLRRGLRHGAEPLLRAGGAWISADRVRQGRTDARLPRHSRHGALPRDCLPESGEAGRVPRVQSVHRAVQRAWNWRRWCRQAGKEIGLKVEIDHLPDPRVEAEEHYYNAKHSRLVDLGLKPHNLSDTLLDSMINIAMKYRDRIDTSLFTPKVNWRKTRNERKAAKVGVTASLDKTLV